MYSELDVIYVGDFWPLFLVIIDLISEQNGESLYLSGKNVF